MPKIDQLTALEILDSRGRPTVGATCVLKNGARAWASVPSGASTGGAEARELRDGDTSRYGGLGCRRAVGHVNGVLNDALPGREFADQAALDRAMIDLDGTADKSRLGANAILAVSIAFARATAISRGVPLYEHFAEILNKEGGHGGPPLRTKGGHGDPRLHPQDGHGGPPHIKGGHGNPPLPRLTINLFSGGKHAGGQVPIQDVLIVPLAARTIDESLSMTYAIYQAAIEHTRRKYGYRPLVADEGGLAPAFPSADAMLQDAADSIRAAGLDPGRDAALAVDVAASHFFRDGKYHLGAVPLDSLQMVGQVARWVREYPIISVEDGLAEEDWHNWPALREAIGAKALVMGDDLLCTNPARIRRAIDESAANALLLKVNQIGTLSEAAEANQLARSGQWTITISARSGETEDDWLADLAVGWAADYIKVGSITRSERLAKYNRLLAIERERGNC